MITNSLKDTRVIFSQEIIDKVYEYTQGHPFEMQALCQKLFDNQIGGRVDDQVWEKSLQQTLMDMGEFIFDHWYRKVTDRDKSVLKILSNSSEPLNKNKIQHIAIDKNMDIDIKSVPDSVEALINNGLVNYFGGSDELLELPDRMFKAYINFFKTSI
jgi:hypothetical protein